MEGSNNSQSTKLLYAQEKMRKKYLCSAGWISAGSIVSCERKKSERSRKKPKEIKQNTKDRLYSRYIL